MVARGVPVDSANHNLFANVAIATASLFSDVTPGDALAVGVDPADPRLPNDVSLASLPHVDVRAYASPQAAVDAQTGRAVIQFPAGTTAFTTDLDLKRCAIEGVGPAPQNGLGGTVLTFAGTSKIYTTVEDTNNFKIRNMQIEGSATATPWTNSQTLVDATGCNYPELHNVRIRKAQLGLKLANGSTVECHYGKFWLEGIQECNVGVEFGSLAHTHNFFGGRFWTCIKGVLIPSGVQNINWWGTAFECGASATEAVDSTGTQINFYGVRWETATVNLRTRSGAGEHWDFGPFHSSGFNYVDENSPGVIYGYGKSSGVNELAILSAAPGPNLLRNGSFEVDSDAGGVADGWTVTQSSSVVHSVSLDTSDFTHGLQSQLLSNTSSSNLRIEQMLTVTPNIPHVVRCKIKTTRASTFLRIGNGVTGASTYINQTLTTSGAWVEYRIGFTPTTAAVNVTLYLNGTGAGDVRIDEISVTPGHLSPPGYPMTPRAAAIIDATGGGTVDAEARTAINAVLAMLRQEGRVTP